jgi:hypothetical protein
MEITPPHLAIICSPCPLGLYGHETVKFAEKRLHFEKNTYK